MAVNVVVIGLLVIMAFNCFGASGAASLRKDHELAKKNDLIIDPAGFVEVIDLLSAAADVSCRSIGRLIEVKEDLDFDYRRRCELFVGTVEELSHLCDELVKDQKRTQKELVTFAVEQGYDYELISLMKKFAKHTLNVTKKAETEIQTDLNSEISRWLINVVTKQNFGEEKGKSFSFGSAGGGGGGSGFGGGIDGLNPKDISPAARATLRKLGMNVGGADAVDDTIEDEDDEGDEDEPDDEDMDKYVRKINEKAARNAAKSGGEQATKKNRKITVHIGKEDKAWIARTTRMLNKNLKKKKRVIEREDF